jgi:RNA polymerase sigma-70 factor, ECF subfamily
VDDLETRLKGLMLRGLDGDAQAHRVLLSTLGDRLRAYFSQRMSGAPADVEDLMQETLLAVHLRRASWDREQPLTPWVFAIARYKLIDHWRRRRIRVTAPLDDIAEFLAAPTVASDDGLDLTRGLQALPAKQRALIEAVKVDGHSLADAGAQAGLSEGAAKVALHRALKSLAERMLRADR